MSLPRPRDWFRHEWAYRLFLVLALIGLLGIVVLDMSQNNWDVLPYLDTLGYSGQYGRVIRWDLLQSGHWDLSRTHVYSYANWLLLLCLLGPFAVARSVDWIVSNPLKDRP